MKKFTIHLQLLLAGVVALSGILGTACSKKTSTTTTKSTDVTTPAKVNDPLKAQVYTLDNGLKVYMTVNKSEPRVQTAIAVRAGSKNDPAETTGLAHYLEHMLFKGTDRMGTTNWEEESKLLDKISDLYEAHKNESDPAKKKAIYKQIDETSQAASKYAVANEYDKMISSLGAKGTNAYTSNEETVYINDIPNNELEKWMKIESERFQTLVLRLFHTELEAVYEEFNISQDNEARWVYYQLLEGLFKNHQYGTQTTIGEGEHLKNPSMENIHAYFDKYYVPNNVAIILAGDIDPEATLAMVKKHFGGWERGPDPAYTPPMETPIVGPEEYTVYGPESESVMIGYRIPGFKTKDCMMMEIVDGMLSNGKAGLIDLNVQQAQKVLAAGSFRVPMKDYSFHGFQGQPKEGQSLEEVRDLMLNELKKIQRGEFDEWLIDAVIADFELTQVMGYESNRARSSTLIDAFIMGTDYNEYISRIAEMKKFTKADLVAYANRMYNDNNYVIVYKRKGENKNIYKVDKPEITPVSPNRTAKSEFMQEFEKMESSSIEPLFLDYERDIKTVSGLNNDGIKFNYIKNTENQIFELNYIVDMGKDNDLYLPLAVSYLPFLGTSKYTADQLQQEFFKLGLSFDVFSSADRSYITLTGLESNLEEGIKLFEHILSDVQPDEMALKAYTGSVLKRRENAKLNKGAIGRAMRQYAIYGKNSSFTNILSEKELMAADAAKLTDMIKGITSYKHSIFYYGQNNPEKVIGLLNTYHKTPAVLKDIPAKKDYKMIETKEQKVYFVDYEMEQANIYMISTDEMYNPEIETELTLFNQYFGSGLSSIVFQEIRESRALAYSAFTFFTTPRELGKRHLVYAFVGTQADKTKDAVAAINELLNDMPVSEQQIASARDAVIKQIQSERITRSSVYWDYLAAKKLGHSHDTRKDMYEEIQDMTSADVVDFFNKHVKGKKYNYVIMGNSKDLDMNMIKGLGTSYEELTLEQIFNY